MTPNAETGKIVKQFMKASRWIPPSLLGGSKAGSPKASFGCALLRHDMSKACAHSRRSSHAAYEPKHHFVWILSIGKESL